MPGQLNFLLLLTLLVALIGPAPTLAAPGQAETDVQKLLKRMTNGQKVGQLFLVSFQGSDAGADSQIAELIRDYYVGGVLLTAENLPPTGANPAAVAGLSNQLQALAFNQPLPPADATATPVITATVRPPKPAEPEESVVRIPLLIGVTHEGNDFPYTWLRNGFTPLPDAMAIGATWHPANAEAVGQIVGRELAAVGVNFLLGPSLDVLDNPRGGREGDLGVRVFGGDPYWVGRMGQAYIQGVHIGSNQRVLTVAKHFPGQGSSDRRPEEEVATVQKPLAALQQVELPPFAAATRLDAHQVFSPTEALMSSHIRYRGFQDNTRQLTPPISLAPQLQTIMNLPEFKPWRSAGGLLVSDSLGVPAVRRYYDAQLLKFPQRQIALDAFTAGNDLLTLTNFALTSDNREQLANIKDTILFFREKYDSDTDFRTRADAAVTRILSMKLKLYRQFSTDNVLVDATAATAQVGLDRTVVAQIAKESITLLYPGPQELADRVPTSPLTDEKLVIFSDSRVVQDCAACAPFVPVPVNALQEIVLRLYGPQATGQVQPANVTSFSFEQLKAVLDGKAAATDAASVEGSVRTAAYLIFAMLDVAPTEVPASDMVKAFLRQRSDSLRDKKIIILALNAPYYLDTTEISKLTAYYGVYASTQPFLEAAVRALFREFTPPGASPVSVPGTNYDLQARLEPDPAQVISIEQFSAQTGNDDAGNPASEPIPVNVGDTLQLASGIIRDRNGNAVPDGTPATYRLFYASEALELPRQEVTTINGVARASVKLERTGELRITMSAGSAKESTTLLVTIQGDSPARIATVVPTPTATPTDTPTPTPTWTPLPTPTNTPEPTAVPGFANTNPSARVDLFAFILGLLGVAAAGGLIYFTQANRDRRTPDDIVRLLGWAAVCGLAAYVLYSLGWLPGATWLQHSLRPWGAPMITFVSGLLPLAALIWRETNAAVHEKELLSEGTENEKQSR
ncbi:MAG: glycoside hydrolase family 3 N-terminal domain-containing protein [Anaerolineae bacterium]